MKKNLKIMSMLGLILVIVLLVSACGNNGGSKANTEASGGNDVTPAKKKIVVGVTVQNLSDEFITMLKEAMMIQAKKYPNLELIINDAEAKPDKQASQMDSFISQKVDAIIINPADANALTPSIESAIKAGIPVITLSSDAAQDVGQKWSGSRNEDAGQLAMQYVADKLGGKGNLAILRGPIGHFAEIGRFAGYKTVLDNNPDMKILYDQTGNWQREQGMSIMENWLQTGKKIDAVVAMNDAMALGALKAIEDAGKKGQIIVIGIDAIKDALDSVKAGGLDATFFQDAIGQAQGAVDMAVKAASGEEIQPNIIPFEAVTAENVDTYYDRISLKK
jgi:inositol transport system substrate-binding protein